MNESEERDHLFKMIRTAKLLRFAWRPIFVSIRYGYSVNFMNYLKELPFTYCTALCNGLRVATESRECDNVCIGLYIDGGSRYETPLENGITHFFEHMAYKGTCTRSKAVLEHQMSCTGAMFNCYTTREMVCYQAQCLHEHVPLVLEILVDNLFNNSIAPNEIETQKQIVLSESKGQDKDMNELLFDYLHATAFQGTTLAQTVIGTSSNLCNFTDETMHTYYTKIFDPSRIVLVVVGCIEHRQIVHLANQYLPNLNTSPCKELDLYRFTGSEVRYRNDSMPMANVAMAFEVPCFASDDYYVMQVAAANIGGWDKSQPGGLGHANYLARGASLSEACEAYQVFNISYKDTGLWGVQFLASAHQLEDMLYLVQTKLMNLCTLTNEEDVVRARREVKTKLLRDTESLEGACHDIGRWILYCGCRPTLYSRICALDDINEGDIKTACQRYLYDRCPAVAAVGPTEALPDYTRIRAGQYWLRV